MPKPFLSPQTIPQLAEVISGGAWNNSRPSIGKYRSAWHLQQFMAECGVDFAVGGGSRVPALTDCLRELQKREDAQEVLTRILERVADPRDFIEEPDRHTAVVDHLNKYLAYDDLELRREGMQMRLTQAGRSSAVVDSLAQKSEIIDFDTVRRDLGRALESAETDPEDAATAACSVVESVCRSILVELELPMPSNLDIQHLYRAVRDPLGLGPDRTDLPALVAEDVRKILSGLGTTVGGIGALRTHAGDAHGRERGYSRIDARIARLTIHAASTIALFLIETWEKRYPEKELRKAH